MPFLDVLTPRQFDFLKVVLDKGALALLIALLGVVISLLIERYKSALTRQVEVSKIETPLITAMLEANEELFTANSQFIRDCAAEFAEFEDWIRMLILKPMIDRDHFSLASIPAGPAAREAPVSSGRTLEEFLVECSRSKAVIELVQRSEFWEREEATGASGSFIRQLYLAQHVSQGPWCCLLYECSRRKRQPDGSRRGGIAEGVRVFPKPTQMFLWPLRLSAVHPPDQPPRHNRGDAWYFGRRSWQQPVTAYVHEIEGSVVRPRRQPA